MENNLDINKELLILRMKKIRIMIENKNNICKVYKDHKKKKKTIYEIDLLISEYNYLKTKLLY